MEVGKYTMHTFLKEPSIKIIQSFQMHISAFSLLIEIIHWCIIQFIYKKEKILFW